MQHEVAAGRDRSIQMLCWCTVAARSTSIWLPLLLLTAPPPRAALPQMLQVKPFEIHFVWGGKGWHGKRQRMREALMYHDPPSYYRQGYFLSVELDYLQVGVCRGWVGGGMYVEEVERCMCGCWSVLSWCVLTWRLSGWG